MPARTRMIMRMYIERNAAAKNTYQHRSEPDWTAIATVPCYTWITGAGVRFSADMTKEKTDIRSIVPKGTDITEDDRVAKVTDRQGVELFGVMYLDAAPLRRSDHFEVRLRAIA